MVQEGKKKIIPILLSAILYLSPASGSFTVGDTFDASIMVNSSEKAINAGQAGLIFANDKLAIQSISKSNSIFSLWTQNPDFSNTAGTINFSGGLPSPGYTGSNGKILNIKFKAEEPGQAEVDFQKGARVLANDGKGTNILANTTGAIFVIKEKKVPPEVPPVVPPEVPPVVPPEIPPVVPPEVPPVVPPEIPPVVPPEVAPLIIPFVPSGLPISFIWLALTIIAAIVILAIIFALIIYLRRLSRTMKKEKEEERMIIKKYPERQINKDLKELEQVRRRQKELGQKAEELRKRLLENLDAIKQDIGHKIEEIEEVEKND